MCAALPRAAGHGLSRRSGGVAVMFHRLVSASGRRRVGRVGPASRWAVGHGSGIVGRAGGVSGASGVGALARLRRSLRGLGQLSRQAAYLEAPRRVSSVQDGWTAVRTATCRSSALRNRKRKIYRT